MMNKNNVEFLKFKMDIEFLQLILKPFTTNFIDSYPKSLNLLIRDAVDKFDTSEFNNYCSQIKCREFTINCKSDIKSEGQLRLLILYLANLECIENNILSVYERMVGYEEVDIDTTLTIRYIRDGLLLKLTDILDYSKGKLPKIS